MMLSLASPPLYTKRQTDLNRIEYRFPMLNRRLQRHLVKDVDLASGRDRSDIYDLTSMTKLDVKGEVSRIRSRWSMVSVENQQQLVRQAEESFSNDRRL